MSFVLKLHRPRLFASVLDFVQSHRIMWLDVKVGDDKRTPAIVAYIPYGSLFSNVKQFFCDQQFEGLTEHISLEYRDWLEFVHHEVVPVIENKGAIAAYSRTAHELIVEALHTLELSHLVDHLIYLDCDARFFIHRYPPNHKLKLREQLRMRARWGMISKSGPIGLRDYLTVRFDQNDGCAVYSYPWHLLDFSDEEALRYIKPNLETLPPQQWSLTAKHCLIDLCSCSAHDLLGMRRLTLFLTGLIFNHQN